jgi:hypothetical protein
MPVVIAHGQPKSGSTFLFGAAVELRNMVDGDTIYQALKLALGEDANAFENEIDAALVKHLLARAGHKTLVIKTHGTLSGDVRALVEAGRVRAFTSFRDPRDACRSMLDAGVSDRAKGNQRFFASKSRVDELVRPIARQFAALQSWLDCPQVLAMPYYIIANDQDFAVRLLAMHLGFGALASVVAAKMQARKTSVPEFHKGISDRFLKDFSLEEIGYLNKVMAAQVATYEADAQRIMAKLGHRMLYARLVAMREARLRELGLSHGHHAGAT